MIMRLHFVVLSLIGLLSLEPASADEAIKATVYKDPACGCCHEYVAYLRENGFDVEVIDIDDLAPIKQQSGVPPALEGCHSTLVGGYVVEGHVPIDAVRRLLQDRPPIRGISLPGMPMGSPGMGGEKTEPFVIYEISDGAAKVYATE
jgi:hypothetical protein